MFIFAIHEYCLYDGTVSENSKRDSLNSLKASLQRFGDRFNDGRPLSLLSSPVTAAERIYLSKIRWICDELGFNPAYADIVGSRLLGLGDADATICTVDGEVPKLECIVDFLSQAFISFTRHSGLTLVTIDDIQWIDPLSWKVIHALWKKGRDVLILCTLRESDQGGKLRRSSANLWNEEEAESRFTDISLGPLERNDVKSLISKALYYHESSIDEKFVNEVYEKTGGIPMFALELLENMKRNNLIEIQKSGFVGIKAFSQGDDVSVPCQYVMTV